MTPEQIEATAERADTILQVARRHVMGGVMDMANLVLVLQDQPTYADWELYLDAFHEWLEDDDLADTPHPLTCPCCAGGVT